MLRAAFLYKLFWWCPWKKGFCVLRATNCMTVQGLSLKWPWGRFYHRKLAHECISNWWFEAPSWSCKVSLFLRAAERFRTVLLHHCRTVQNGSATSVKCRNSRTIQNYLERFWNYFVFCSKTTERFRTVLWPRLWRLQNGLERFCGHSSSRAQNGLERFSGVGLLGPDA